MAQAVASLITEQFADSLGEHGVTRLNGAAQLLNHGPANGEDRVRCWLRSCRGDGRDGRPSGRTPGELVVGLGSLEVETYDLPRAARPPDRMTEVVDRFAQRSGRIAVETTDGATLRAAGTCVGAARLRDANERAMDESRRRIADRVSRVRPDSSSSMRGERDRALVWCALPKRCLGRGRLPVCPCLYR